MSASEIIERVASEHGIGPRDIRGQDRRRQVAWPRQRVMWELHKTGLSLGQIARMLGNRHHTTVLHGLRAYERRVADQ